MKRAVALILTFIIASSVIGCSNTEGDEKQGITILIRDYECEGGSFFEILKNYALRYEYETGVKVSFDAIKGSNEEDYIKKTNSKLYLKNGPTLIFMITYRAYDGTYITQHEDFINQGVAFDVKDKIPNLSKVYDSLFEDGYYYIPISMETSTVFLNKDILDKLGVETPELDWTRDEYFKIKEKTLEEEPEHFTRTDYREVMIPKANEILSKDDKKIDLNNDDTINFINNFRKEILSGKYILNKNYRYKNYYNMLFVKESEEFQKSQYLELYYKYDRLRYDAGESGLRSLDTNSQFEINDFIILPNVIGDQDKLIVRGLMVNNNGKNKELGMDFINYLLKDDLQLEIFNSKYYYPVNKGIEDDISKIEEEKDINKDAVALRKYILSQIENGNYKRSTATSKQQKIQGMLCEDFVKFIFADKPYSDEELRSELQRLENKYNMWLNE